MRYAYPPYAFRLYSCRINKRTVFGAVALLNNFA